MTPSSATPSPVSPVQELQQLARAGQTAVFHATYDVRQRHPSSRATWSVWRTRHSLRVDVVTKRSTATLIQTQRATFSCSRSRHHRACFRVAKAGKPVPGPLRLLAEQLFTTDLDALAAHPERYGIAAAEPGSVTVATHGGTCFHLTVPKRTTRGSLGTGIYCFDSQGILTAIEYPNGNIVRLTRLVTTTPANKVFVPYSSPTPLPH